MAASRERWSIDYVGGVRVYRFWIGRRCTTATVRRNQRLNDDWVGRIDTKEVARGEDFGDVKARTQAEIIKRGG